MFQRPLCSDLGMVLRSQRRVTASNSASDGAKQVVPAMSSGISLSLYRNVGKKRERERVAAVPQHCRLMSWFIF